jgi:hypothetical protein
MIVFDLLNKQGHCCFYSELQRFETGVAEGELLEAREQGVVIPGNIKGGFGFIQAAADNDDFMEDTIDGKRTTHATTMVLYQNQSASPVCVRLVRRTRQKRLKRSIYENLLKLRVINKAKERPQPPSITESTVLRQIKASTKSCHTESMDKAYRLDQEWILSRLTPTKSFELNITPNTQRIPSWSAFNTQQETLLARAKTAVGYCPMIDNSSTDPGTVYTVMWQLKTMMEQLNQKFSVITFDHAIYHIAKEIQWERPHEFMNTVIRMGGFHIRTNFMSVGSWNHASN